jgi:ribosomal protein S18 acetylase RimI-like enzyme
MNTEQSVDLVDTNVFDLTLAQTLADAFHDDPAMSWILQDPVLRRAALPKLFKVLIRSDRRTGWVFSSPAHEAVTLWRAPGHTDAPLGEMIGEALPLIGALGRKLPRALTLSDAIEAYHPKTNDYWYLHIAGVAPHHQGKGWGGIAIREGLKRAAQQGKAVLLETATPSNVPLYQRLGFVVTQEWDAPKGGPHFWTMWRQAS